MGVDRLGTEKTLGTLRMDGASEGAMVDLLETDSIKLIDRPSAKKKLGML